MRWLVRALLFACCLGAVSSPARALSGGHDDVGTPLANSTVSLNGNSCSGTLIASQLVMTAGHCGSINAGSLPEVDGTYVPSGQWWPLASPFTVRVGPDPNTTDVEHIYTATYMTQAGWADIQLIMLDRPVPAAQAIPARPLTQLSPTQRVADFWRDQSFTVAGFGGGRARRQTASWRIGAYPCKNASNLAANDEFICSLAHDGAELEAGDSGGPLYWADPATRVRYVIGAYQGNVQFLRLCETARDGEVDTSSCRTATFQTIVTGADGCGTETSAIVNRVAWAPMHHTATFFTRGRCWTDLAGKTRHQPNIAQWLDDALRWAPTAGDATLPVVIQRTTGPNPHYEILPYTGSDTSPVLARAIIINPHAPNLWPAARAAAPIWRFRLEGRGDKVIYTSQFPGHAFVHQVWGDMTLYAPVMLGYVWNSQTAASNLVALNQYTNLDTHESLTTWDLAGMFPDPAMRARWQYNTRYGFVQQVAVPVTVTRPITPRTPPLTLPPLTLPPPRTPHS